MAESTPVRHRRCPKCGCEIQCTAKAYFTLTDGQLLMSDIPIEEAEWYCENDHTLPPELVQELCDEFKHLGAFGREPGSGWLEIPVA